MKRCLFILLTILCYVVLGYSQEQSENEAETEKQRKSRSSPKKQTGINEFYQDRGFEFIPKSQFFSLRNIVRNSVYYDSNVFLLEEDVIDDGVYAAELESQFKAGQGHLQCALTGGLRYEEYFNENSLDEFLPRGQINLSYGGDVFYAMIDESILRSSSPNTAELSERSPTVSNNFSALVGFRHMRLFAELKFHHTYLDYRDIKGDSQNYGVSIITGYEIHPRIYGVGEYICNAIDYKEAFVINGKKQQDTVGHSVLVGARIELTNKLVGSVKTGFNARDNDFFWAINMGLQWIISPDLHLEVSLIRQTVPSFFGDFQTTTSGGLAIDYLITPKLAAKVSSSIVHSDLQTAKANYLYNNNFTLIYRIISGIDVELFYWGSLKDSKNPSGDYVWHRAGGSFVITF